MMRGTANPDLYCPFDRAINHLVLERGREAERERERERLQRYRFVRVVINHHLRSGLFAEVFKPLCTGQNVFIIFRCRKLNENNSE